MHLKFKGALTYENDAALEEGLQAARAVDSADEKSFISMDDIETIGLHVTISKSGDAAPAQVAGSEALIRVLAAHAYSGYIDIITGDQSERYHAKEIQNSQNPSA